jgi:hypothetical protein
LVVAGLVEGEEVHAQKDGAQGSEVVDVTLDVFLGTVLRGVHPLQLATPVEPVAIVDEIGHGDIGTAGHPDGAIRDR